MIVIRNEPNAAVLSNLYDIIRETITEKDAYYSDEEVKALKENEENIIFRKG